MKAKSSYTGLESVSLSFSAKNPEVLKLTGDNARMGLINDLFDSGNPDEARKQLRNALADISQNLDKILAAEKRDQDTISDPADTTFLTLRLEN
ncbi:MAG: hypothetical protein ACYDG4_01015 [Desulfuromonadaceae bacterium]